MSSLHKKSNDNRMYLFLLLIAVMTCGIWYIKYLSNHSFLIGTKAQPEELSAKATQVPFSSMIQVEIQGEVNTPGFYTVSREYTVGDLISIAGGFTNNAQTANINLSDAIFEDECITIPAKGETALVSIAHRQKQSEKKDNKETSVNKVDIPIKSININTADSSQLDTLPGIGEKIANSIIQYREENGDFQSIEEIKNVPKIGDKIFEQIKDRITIE